MPISQLVRSAVSGMVGHKLHLDVIANNLANVNTTGFKASRLNFQDALYQAHRLATTNRDLRVGAGLRPAEIQPVFTQGSLQSTGLPTDLAIYGDGFFQVRLPDGTLGYTRNGAFRLDADGRLVTSDGLELVAVPLGGRDAVTIPAGEVSSMTVDEFGVIRIARFGETQSEEIGQITLARFTNPEGLQAIGQTLYRQSESSGGAEIGLPVETPGFGQIVQQTLEVSNVTMADEMANLVMAQRAYGLSLKALQTIDEMLGMANNMRAR